MGALLDKALDYSIKKGYIDANEAQRSKAVVQRIAAKHGFPEEWLVKMIFVEAEGFNPKAGANSGCIGVVQLCKGENNVLPNLPGGARAFLNLPPSSQLELWDKYHLSYWLRQSKRKVGSQGELMVVNILPARFLDIAAGRMTRDTPMNTSQASFLYTDFNPKTGRRTGGGYWSANSASRGMDWKVQSILKESFTDSTTPNVTTAAAQVANIVANPGQVITQALTNSFNSAMISGQNCNPPEYTQQERIIYPGCLTKVFSNLLSGTLTSGATAPAVTSLQPSTTNANPTSDAKVATTVTQPTVTDNPPQFLEKFKPGRFIVPMKRGTYRVTSPWGWRWGRMHRGIDLGGPMGTPIYAAADGKVTKTVTTCSPQGYEGNPCGGKYGNQIILDHGNGSTLYAHLQTVLVKTGDSVKQGQLIAKLGNSGSSTGPHLHFEIRPNYKAENPQKFLTF